MKRISLLAMAAVVGVWVPGCIVQDIHDELKSANSQLGDVQQSLTKLDTTNEELTRTSELIDEVQQGLARIDTTNSSLTQVDQRLAVLDSIDRSLTRLDAHLASLRKTISSLDESIPFLSFGDSAEAVPDLGAAPTPPDAEAAPPAAEPPPGEVTAAPPADQAPARDPMVGAWVTRYPDDTRALIFAPDGAFMLSRRNPDGSTAEFIGEWNRKQRTLTLTGRPAAQPQPTPPASPAPAPPATTPGADAAAPEAPAQPAPISRTLDIVMVTGRSVTVRLDGELIILVRP